MRSCRGFVDGAGGSEDSFAERIMEIHSYRINGVVQGVGFRPFIHKLASRHDLKGWILNDSEGVVIEVEGKRESLDCFINDVRDFPPPIAQIDAIIKLGCESSTGKYKTFEIKESVKMEKTQTLIPPDSFVCEDCVREMFDPADSRFGYPFINCTNCGPRYSIIKEMPYDRQKTTMSIFPMCPACDREYHDIGDRRYHAQPTACPVCGPKLELLDQAGNPVVTDDIVGFTKDALKQGKIFAIKSVGGFHIAVNAHDEAAVKALRTRKKRDWKPFALMTRDVEIARRYVHLCGEEIALLESVQRPIVILKKRPGVLPEAIAPGNPSYGVMLPSAPLHHLLLDDAELPVLIMTSGNISGQPTVFCNSEALRQLAPVVDYFLMNNRDIHIRVDDSIARCTSSASLERKIISFIRRSRGYAPYPVKISRKVRSVLALGSELKATTALSKHTEVFVSQHIGDLKNEETYHSLDRCSEHLKGVLSIRPELIACDAHPSFRATNAALAQTSLPVVLVQHHHAHMASCMAENGVENKVIGVVFDGTGYGLDGTIWGGEFLVGDYVDFERAGHLSPFYLLGGDKAVNEPFRVAIDLLYRTYGADFTELKLPFLGALGSHELSVLTKMAERKINAFQTTSMGRLFDAVSALLGVCPKIEYEAQAAIELESLLNREFSRAEPFRFDIFDRDGSLEVDYRPLVRDIVAQVSEGKAGAPELSRRFHSTIVDTIALTCSLLRERYGINEVALSGGVFMNEYLTVNAIAALRATGFTVYHHSVVPTNDGGISLGQVMVADARAND